LSSELGVEPRESASVGRAKQQATEISAKTNEMIELGLQSSEKVFPTGLSPQASIMASYGFA
jgi:hypothetical protein